MQYTVGILMQYIKYQSKIDDMCVFKELRSVESRSASRGRCVIILEA